MMSKKIPFRISARTARLIGRQNFPNAEGAIIELIKNSYDADASTCIVFFDNRYAVLPAVLSSHNYKRFCKQETLISTYYQSDEERGNYVFEEPIAQTEDEQEKTKTEKRALQAFFRSQCKLYIIDNGEGMTDRIIEDYWMTIGTNNKETDIFTRMGRVKTGEKGIGRFALDKLGDAAELLTKPDLKAHPDVTKDTAFLWQIDWNAFEGNTKTLNEVEADLIDTEDVNFSQEIKGILPEQIYEHSELDIGTFKTGTRIEISKLRDEWNDGQVAKIFKNLEVLIPPREERIFDIFLFSFLTPGKYGQVAPSIYDDYDYKVTTRVNADGMAEITIQRNEFDVARFPDELFKQGAMQKEGFTRDDFERGKIVINRHITQLTPGLADVDKADVLRSIGAFEFVFYFIKITSTKKSREKFLYKDFHYASRKKWIEQFGGIKIFRDDFRIRPYGEPNSAAFDWLKLGDRASKSPASIGQQRGLSWRVRPNQISGIINISRLANIDFEDTSSRYGLQENQTFEYFSKIIEGILSVFEKDRNYIGRALKAYYDDTHKDEISEEEAEAVKRRVGKNRAKPDKLLAEADAVALLKLSEQLEEQIEELKSETSLLRILASNGLVTASFTHELRNIKNNLVLRIDELDKHLLSVVDMDRCRQLPKFLNPFTDLRIIKHEDEKLKAWLHYSLETLRKDKRRRKNIDLLDYFRRYRTLWAMMLEQRGARLDLQFPEYVDELKIRIFESDLDSIFNNLLINSFEAFLRRDAPPERVIVLKLELRETDMHIVYSDSGPGLSKDITEPESIFNPLFTTKRDPLTGEETGTGLGMWLVKTFVTENNGTIDMLEQESGFGVSIKFPNKVKR